MAMPEGRLRITSGSTASLIELSRAALLGQDEVRIWHGSIEFGSDEIRSFSEILCEEERQRAQRFHFDKHRNRYVASRAMLRMLIAGQIGLKPAAVQFQYTKYGKPYLARGVDPPASPVADLHFNVSHSEGYAAFVLAGGRKVGVDVERIRNDFNVMDLAERFFSASEKEALRRIPEASAAEAFFRCWTRKESYIKAIGEGLSHPLDQFDVSLEPDPENALVGTRPNANVSELWMIQPFATEAGFVGAVAVERMNRQGKMYRSGEKLEATDHSV